ncbi:MAG: B12-binding domain-containing radical SAM protein [Promethearchaeota archaeon]
MIDILLIQPKIRNWDYSRSDFVPPLSLLFISTLIHEKYKIKIFDQRFYFNWKKELSQIIETNNIICVGITSMTGEQFYHALIISKFIKTINPNIPIVWGGIQPTLISNTLIKNQYVDIIVKGEGETTFSELIDHLKLNKNLRDVKGIIFKEKDNIIENEDRELLILNDLPPIPYYLVDMKKYLPRFKNERLFYLQTSRGCPHDCIFCYNVPFNRRHWRALKAEKVIEQIKRIMKLYNVNHFYIIDDNFFVSMKRAKKIVSLINKEKLGIHWQIQGVEINSLYNMDEKFISELEKSGLTKISVGLETASLRLLKFVGKNFTIKRALEVNRKLSKFNIIVYYNIICGLPQETDNEIRLTIQLILKIFKENRNARLPFFFACTPFPGTALYDYCSAQGFIKKEGITSWIKSTYDNMNAYYLDSKRIKFLNKVIFLSFFLDKKFLDYNFSIFNNLFKVILNFYRIFAKFRMKYWKFNFLIEKFIFDRYIKTISRLFYAKI